MARKKTVSNTKVSTFLPKHKLVPANLAVLARLTNNAYFGYNMGMLGNWSRTQCIEPIIDL